MIEILVNETDYASCDRGHVVEILCGDIDWCESDGGGFSWEWDNDERENTMANAVVGATPVPENMEDDDQIEAHLQGEIEKVATMLRERGFDVGFF